MDDVIGENANQPLNLMNQETDPKNAAAYEAPVIETVFRSEEIEREAHYAALASMFN